MVLPVLTLVVESLTVEVHLDSGMLLLNLVHHVLNIVHDPADVKVDIAIVSLLRPLLLMTSHAWYSTHIHKTWDSSHELLEVLIWNTSLHIGKGEGL